MNVDNYVVVVVGFTAADGFGASGETVVLLAPNVIKGVKIMDQNNEVDQTRKIIETTEESVKLYPMATNDSEDKIAPEFTCTVSNKNFEAVWNGEYVVVQAIEGAANPYGTVKVTIKAADGSNVSNYTTIKFVQPEPAT